jgi:eukaryotic-like serine/threonine-protein kinase
MNPACENDLAGTTVSRYAIVDLIGVGGMGQVYRARDERLQRNVAIKVRGRQADSQVDREPELVTEARALSRLSHPHIAAIYDFLTEAEREFIVMEFVPGATLKEILTAGPLPLAEVLRLGRQMMQGLAAAHAAQLVHRDIKPANLKITTSGELKILDFGLAQPIPLDASPDTSTRPQTEFGPAGTMPYMAPEQLCGRRADERSDIFSAGAVLYEMATGQPAFPQRTFGELVDAILHQHPKAPSELNDRVPVAFDRLVGRAMQKRPGRRYQTAIELDDALDTLSADHGRAPASSIGHWISNLLGRRPVGV